MLANDKLTRRERIRLEALAQAQGLPVMFPDHEDAYRPTTAEWTEAKLIQAEQIEAWLLSADNRTN